MKVSVSIPDEDIAFLDEYAKESGSQSRSAALHDAIKLLRLAKLEEAYTLAFREWDDSEDSALWDAAAGDGLHASR
ncbi:ribbon-helix-helix domain-containing protein [Nonomuraea typhae]|uniref:Ribbon-helix-helix domain-containing protein n=1 Tax=Nonomuraea typhae TaxID=2603600 RepID=A0ABW7YR88_9ACTN